jgi:hypothetical protein
MRTIKELLQLMLEHQDLFETGLCWWARRMVDFGIITESEDNILIDYIEDSEPENIFTHWWTVGELQPRIDWINEQIEKLS